MEKIITYLTDLGLDICLNILFSLLIMIIGLKVNKILIKLLEKGMTFKKIEKSVQLFIKSFISITFKVVLLIIVLNIIGVPMASIVTILGSVGLALGLALQGGLSNIAGGIIILVFKPFKIGDYIKVNLEEGTVTNITIFHTTLTTIDNKLVVMPNGNLANSVLTNYTANDKRRIDLNFSVDYKTNLDKVKKVLLQIAEKNELILKDEEVVVKLSDYTDSSLIIVMKVWVKTENYWTVNYDIKEEVKKVFEKEKISIPFPQMDIHVKK